jgi:hypothetical protein
MSYPINYPTPQGANVQIFELGGSTSDWVKPQGASFVWFTLIGAGGGGGGAVFEVTENIFRRGGGGASGNVTNFMCPAFLMPDQLRVSVGRGGAGGAKATDTNASAGSAGTATSIIYQQKNTTGYVLVQASAGSYGEGATVGANGTGGTPVQVDTGGPMTAAGFYQSTYGQDGATTGVITTNNLTFLMGGSGGRFPTQTITGYYGYTAQGYSGYSQLSPIPLSIPASYSDENDTVIKQTMNSFGCGGNGGGDNAGPGPATNGGRGGDGLAIIVTW